MSGNIVMASQAHQINELHAQACRHATKAVDVARQAGALLLQVKNQLAHGEFTSWLALHCEVSPRQAQRYMRAASEINTAPRTIAKSAIVSDLPERESDFVPAPGCLTYTRADGKYFLVEQSTYPEHFFVSASALAGPDDAVYDSTTKPVRCDYVEVVLQQMGLARPSGCAWIINQIQPVGAPREVCHG